MSACRTNSHMSFFLMLLLSKQRHRRKTAKQQVYANFYRQPGLVTAECYHPEYDIAARVKAGPTPCRTAIMSTILQPHCRSFDTTNFTLGTTWTLTRWDQGGRQCVLGSASSGALHQL
eukprot:GHRR01024941.1.p1 GENE.GHRR01024941.1~~GHRR01024941.1.p1  ORF type:complete len:118 (+),score=6.26 GHRR01024941.1:297-650(+)